MRSLWLALGFLTWLPVPSFIASDRELGRAIALFPVVGLGLGALLAGLHLAMAGHLALSLQAALLVGLLAWLSGGLHLDGLADTFDALGSSAKADPVARRARMLEVMRDPRTGPHGALSLALVLLGQTLALGEAISASTLLLLPAVGRAAAALLVVGFPSARSDGLGRAFQSTARRVPVWVGALLLGGLAWWIAPQAAMAMALALGAALAFGRAMAARLGGLSGDVYGAGLCVAELAFVVVMAWRP